MADPAFWRGRRVFITGHTGFKGGWLALWLRHLGAEVTGFALPPEHGNGIFAAAGIGSGITSTEGDIRHAAAISSAMEKAKPEIVFHLAAQALVRRAQRDPQETYSTNLLGTANVLQAMLPVQSVHAAVVVTSDKVYENDDAGRPFVEDDPLGGKEPYGVSKAGCEMIASAFRASLPPERKLAVATVRAGNVIGGGDWAEDRILADAMRAFTAGTALVVRHPASTRPWQFVLDPLHGYLLLAERLVSGAPEWASAWNFGPAPEDAVPVSVLADRLVALWNRGGGTAQWVATNEAAAPYEARLLAVDAAKARGRLDWAPRMSLDRGLAETVAWHKALAAGTADMTALSLAMIDRFSGAQAAG